MLRKILITTVSVGAVMFSVFAVVGGNVSEQTAFLADGGIASGNRVATCPVQIDPECLGLLRGGAKFSKHERLRFPVHRSVSADGGVAIQLPPMRKLACIEVKDWSDCTLDPNATHPAVAALWGNPLPFSKAGVSKKCVRQKADAGLTCLRQTLDGGSRNPGDRNVFPRNEAIQPLTCEPVECTIVLGEDPEDVLTE